ncbi:MAG: amidohydrolase family protein [Clostridia bacterium]
MIIDTHCHIFPDAIAERAAANTGKFYGIVCCADGRLSTLKRLEKAAGVDRVLVCSAATTITQTTIVNDYIAKTVGENPGLLFGLGAMNQDYPDKAGEVARIRALGLKGVKIHPEIQGVAINDRRFDELYDALSQCGMPLLAHTGDLRYHNSNPPEVLEVLRRFPRLTLIAAHLGSWSNWTEGVKALAGRENVYVDCSSSLYAMTPEAARKVIRGYGADRVLFGSDYPMWEPETERARLAQVGLTQAEMEKILGGNAQALLAID